MEDMTLHFTCPDCGRELLIPKDLEEFSCMYCGARHRRPAKISGDPGKAAEAFDTLKKELPDCVTNYPGVFRRLTRKEFPPYFEGYVDACRETFNLLPDALSMGDGAAERLAEALVDALAARCPKGSALDEAKYTLCLLMIPGIRSLELNGGEEFCLALHRVWMKRYPKNPFQPVTYAEIDAGFQRKKLCFITTAVCQYQGKPDDCAELTAFRAFRDGWLAQQPRGRELIEAYYACAPGIVTAINVADCPDAVYPAIWKRHLAPCYEALEQGRMADCAALYTQMVRELAGKYLQRELAQ